jgi:sulfoxide reductase heme-binding subunit YedZ
MQKQITTNKAGLLGNFGKARLQTHGGLALFTLCGCGLAYRYESAALLSDIIALGTAYVALILLVATLAIGPLNLVLKRRNPVNIDLRRDIGIWVGITGVIHTFFSLQLYNKGDLIQYFFNKQSNGNLTPQFNLFSLSNILGLIALLILLALIITSNNLSLRYLKGKRWKFIQRFNYPMFILVVGHTIGYMVLNQRESSFTALVVALVFFTIEVQLAGIVLSVIYERRRVAATKVSQPPPPIYAQYAMPIATPAPPPTQAGLEQNKLARRRFLVLSGVTVLTGVSSVVALSAALADYAKTNGKPNNTNASTNPSQQTTINDSAGVTNSNSNSSSNSGNVATAAPDTNSSDNSNVLATMSSLPVGACITFSTPDTGDNAFLIHEQDGSVKAFSNLCTHRPYELTYMPSRSSFYCALHGATFDIKTGAATGGPVRYGLTPYQVQVDSKGKILYIKA